MILIAAVFLIFISSASVQITASSSSKQSQGSSRDGNIDSFSISPSFSYQYHTNDHGDYEVDVPNSGTLKNKKKATKGDSKTNKVIQWDDFVPPSDPKFSYAGSPVVMDNYAPRPVPLGSYGSSISARDSYEPPAPVYGSPPAPVYYNGGQGGGFFGGPGGGIGGPSGGDAPPPSIKGSIDYVLIPLILIGIAAPIFVVLYVVLGAFESKLSPITTRSTSWTNALSDSFETLKPSTNLLFTTLSNALDQHECMERAMCHVGSFGRSFGLDRLTFLNKTVEAVTREPYKRSLQMLFASMTNKPESCSAFKCP